MSSIRRVFLFFMGMVRGCVSVGVVFWFMFVYDFMVMVVVWGVFRRSVSMRAGMVPPLAMAIMMSGW